MNKFLLCALLSSPALAAAPKAPNFKIARVLNAPVSKIDRVSELKGKVVFLEFWATWCPPCVAGIPHMNRVIDALKGEPVVFLSVTDEPAGTIETFRKTHEMKSWVGIDEAQSSLKAYHVESRPQGYLIGKDGTLLASFFPDDLKEKDVRDALAGRFAPRPVEWEAAPAAKTSAPADKVYFEARISAASGKFGTESAPGAMEARSFPFADGVASFWDVPIGQVIVDTAPVAAFNYMLKTPPDDFERGRELLKSAFQSAFGVRVAPERRETDVFVLSLSSAAGAPRPKPGAAGVESGLMSWGPGRLLGKVPMSSVARGLCGANLGKPVVDETGLKGDYDFDMEWAAGDRAALDGLLAAQGLSLVPARRAVEFLRVSPAKPLDESGRTTILAP